MKKLLICISGSIAAVKLPLLIHKLVTQNYICRVIITHDGLNFVTPMAISSMGADVYLDDSLNSTSYDQVMQHINLGKWADYILICPASANTLAKLSNGQADNLLTSTVLASSAEKIIVPAMNQLMWANSIVQKNLNTLKEHGFICWGPSTGLQACGDTGMGRMLEIEEIVEKLTNLTNTHHNLKLANKHIVITAGGTREMIDPVRFISNQSSGKMGYALAQAAKDMGAKVTIISASNLNPPQEVDVIAVNSSEEMLQKSLEIAPKTDIFIGCAAVCDYKIRTYNPQKIKKSDSMTLELVSTTDIIKTIRKKCPELFIVGFAAETNNLIEYAKAKLINKQLNMIVANDVSNNQVFNKDISQVTIINNNLNTFTSEVDNKQVIAKFIMEHLVNDYYKPII